MIKALAAQQSNVGRWHAARSEFSRLAVGLIGPMAIAGTQFLAAMLLWRAVSPAEFGLFSFAIILIQFSFGLSNALVGTPLSVAPRDATWPEMQENCLTVHALLLVIFGFATPAALWLIGASSNLLGFALLAITSNLRWAARSKAIAKEDVSISARADCTFAVVALGLLGFFLRYRALSVASVVGSLTAANLLAIFAFNRDFLRAQLHSILYPKLSHYRRSIWPTQVRWSLSGVITTEASSNAHGYLVTGLAGAAAFAPLAFASLFFRPVTIFLSAITQIDRPVFARLLREQDAARVKAMLARSYVSAGLSLLANAVLAAIAAGLFSASIAAKGYDMGIVRSAIFCWFAIMACRVARNPMATLLQAQGAFGALAASSLVSALISVGAVAVLAARDPQHSLYGILIGEFALLAGIALAYARRQS